MRRGTGGRPRGESYAKGLGDARFGVGPTPRRRERGLRTHAMPGHEEGTRRRTVRGTTGGFIRVARSGAGGLAVAMAVVGCVTQADLLQQERKLSGMIEQQSRSLDELKRDIEALREERAPRGSGMSTKTPFAKTPARPKEKKKMAAQPAPAAPALAPNEAIGQTPAPDAVSTEGAEPSPAPSEAVAAEPPPAPAAATPSPAAETTGAPAASSGAVDEAGNPRGGRNRARLEPPGAR